MAANNQLRRNKLDEQQESFSDLPIPTVSSEAQVNTVKPVHAEGSDKQTSVGGIDTESTGSNSESEEDSEEESDCDDDGWSGANDYFEAKILNAVYPDLELAAHLITHLHSMFYPGLSKKLSNKVWSWQERITMCPNGSSTTTSKNSASSNATTSTPRAEGSKRRRRSDFVEKSPGEEDDDEDEDTDENRRKKPKDKADEEYEIPSQRMACPFYKKNPLKYCTQLNQDGKFDDKLYRTCAGPGFRTIALLKYLSIRPHKNPVLTETGNTSNVNTTPFNVTGVMLSSKSKARRRIDRLRWRNWRNTASKKRAVQENRQN